jgi:hypothetical protein
LGTHFITLREAKQSLKAADEEYRRLKVNAPMMRQDFLRDWMRDDTLSEKARTHAKQCLKKERQRDNAQRMKHMRGKHRAGAVSRVSTGQGEDYREYEDRATVERLIIANNAARFRLTENYSSNDGTAIIGPWLLGRHRGCGSNLEWNIYLPARYR